MNLEMNSLKNFMLLERARIIIEIVIQWVFLRKAVSN